MDIYHHCFYHHTTNMSRQCLFRLSTTFPTKKKADCTIPDIAFTLHNFSGHTPTWIMCIHEYTVDTKGCQHYRTLTVQVIILPLCTHPTLPRTWCLLTNFQIFLYPFLKMNIYLVLYHPLIYLPEQLLGWMSAMLKLREENVLHG